MRAPGQGIGSARLWPRTCRGWPLASPLMWWRIAGLALLLAGCGAAGPFAEVDPGPGPGTVTVIRVIDGDSLLVQTGAGRVEVRLDGVNTPERGECHHEEARDRLREIIGDSLVTMEQRGIDRFGRSLARLTVEGTDIALDMARGGHGVALATAPDPQPLLEAEESAYRDGLGMWGGACRSDAPTGVGFDAAAGEVDPPGRDEERLGAEIVVVANLGERAVDLSGWIVRDGSSRHRFRFNPGTVIAPGERLEVGSSSPGWSPGGEAVWSNSGDVAILLDEAGRVVARWRYYADSR